MRYLILFSCIFFFFTSKGQEICPDAFDKYTYNQEFPTDLKIRTTGWEQIDAFSDHFTHLDLSKWNIKDNYCTDTTYTVSYDDESNVVISNTTIGILELRTKRVPQGHVCNGFTYYYSSAFIGTDYKFQYGYVEVKCILPEDIALNPCFWLWGFTIPESRDTIWDEIDVFEKQKDVPSNIIMMQNAYHWYRWGLHEKIPSLLCRRVHFNQPYVVTDTTIYAIEWLPEELHYFINGNLITSVRYTTNSSYWDNEESPWTCINFIYKTPIWIILSNVVNWTVNPNSNLDIPFKIDYVKSFKLREDNSILEFWPPYFSMNYPGMFSVHKSIRLGGKGHTAIIPPNQNITMLAKDYIILDKGFTVEGNTEFTARTIKAQPALFIDSIPEKGKSNE